MREIKFRVFDKDYKKMHIVGKEGHDSLTCWDGKIQYYNLQNGEGSGEHGSYILMQYTGLTDKNGKELYFNDYIHVYFGGKYNKTVPIKDIYDLSNLIRVIDDHGATFKIYGNAYENPELLEGAN